jgi:hypothetical protein
MYQRRARLLALILPLAIATAASGVIIDSGNGTGNVTAPPSDPGWHNVGLSNASGLSAVYLGNGWVLSANHVGPGDVWFDGVLYPAIPGVSVQLSNPDTSLADLVLFRIAEPLPALPVLSIPTTPPLLTTSLVLIGNGRDRGAATTWDPPGPGPTYDGYFWGPGATKRWGTNFVENVNVELYEPAFSTQLFGCEFHEFGIQHSTHEAQGAVGDSGGAAFASNGSGYDLAGILIGILTYTGQPADTALYGNVTVAADLSVYRDEIVDWMPEPSGAGWAGAGLVAALARARKRRISVPSSPGSRRTSDRAR